MATIEEYYEELGKFGHLGQTYSLDIIKELKDAKERIAGLEKDCGKAVEMRMESIRDNAKLILDLRNMTETANEQARYIVELQN